MNQSISTGQLMMIFLLSTGLVNHVFIIPILLNTAGRDAWITALLSTVAFILWIFMFSVILKKINHEHIQEWLKLRVGKVFTFLILFIISLYSLSASAITLSETITFNSFYLQQTPRYIVSLLFILICFYNSFKGLRSIAITAGILLPIVFFLGFFVGIANSHNKDFSHLQPFLENGYVPILHSAPYLLVSYLEIILIAFMYKTIQKKISFLSLLSLLLMLLGLTLGPLIGAIVEFGITNASLQRYPAYEEWRLLTIGRYIEHIDFLSIYQWFSGAYIRISFLIYLICHMFNLKGGIRLFTLIGLYGAIFVFSILPISDMTLYIVIQRIILPVSFWSILLVSIMLFVISYLPKHKERRTNVEEVN